jgi:O-antigen/teichoic acid export membrane protein
MGEGKVARARGAASLHKLVLTSAGWNFGRAAVDQIFRFAVFAVLARLLMPAEFGLFALTVLFVDLARVLTVTGWGDVLVRAETMDEELTNTVFWGILGLSGVLALLVAAASPLAGAALAQEQLPLLLTALAVSLLFSPLSVVCGARAAREFRQKELTFISLTSSGVAGLVAITAAFSGWGLWSLVIQVYVGGALSVLLLWWRFPFTPKAIFSYSKFTSSLKFSATLIGGVLAQVLVTRIQDLINGKYLGAASVGQYRIAVRAFELINSGMIAPLSGVAMPALSRLRSDQERFISGYLRMVGLTAAAACPAAIGFAAVAHYAVPLLFGAQWGAAIPVIQVLSLLAPATVLSYFTVPALTAYGRVKTVAHITIIQLAGTIIFSLLAVQYGIVALAWAWVIRSYLTLPVQLHLIHRATGIPPRRVLLELAPSLAGSLMMAVSLYLLIGEIEQLVASNAARLAISAALGAAVYGLVMGTIFYGFTRTHVRALKDIIRPRAGGGKNNETFDDKADLADARH